MLGFIIILISRTGCIKTKISLGKSSRSMYVAVAGCDDKCVFMFLTQNHKIARLCIGLVSNSVNLQLTMKKPQN